MQKEPNWTIRCATEADLDTVTEIESICFPAAEAATRERFAERLAVFADHFFLMELDGKIVGFINGMVTDRPVIEDEMFEKASMHTESGAWQSVFGLDVLPDFRCRGLAAKLIEHLIEHARQQGRRGCILTCKDKLIHYYARFGFVNQGVSHSEHGGAVWYDMTLTF